MTRQKIYMVTGYMADGSIRGSRETASSIIGVFGTLGEARNCVRSEMEGLRDHFTERGVNVVYDPYQDPDDSFLWFGDDLHEVETRVKEMELGEIVSHVKDTRI